MEEGGERDELLDAARDAVEREGIAERQREAADREAADAARQRQREAEEAAGALYERTRHLFSTIGSESPGALLFSQSEDSSGAMLELRWTGDPGRALTIRVKGPIVRWETYAQGNQRTGGQITPGPDGAWESIRANVRWLLDGDP